MKTVEQYEAVAAKLDVLATLKRPILPPLDLPGFDEVCDGEWAEPVPLVENIAADPYPLDALPLAMREAVEEVQGFAQAPVAMVATSALSALSMAAQAQHDVRRAEKLTGPIGLFTLVLADSGERKTTCDEFFMPAIRQWQRAQEEAMRPQAERYEAARDAWGAERDGLIAKIKDLSKHGKPTDGLKRELANLQSTKPEPPRVPRLIYSDITPEELGYQLAKRWPSAAITASEGGTVLGGHSMTGDSAMRNMARLNDLWSGQEISSDRRTSESWATRGARLTVGLQVQESTLRAFFDKSAGLARGSGFLARFLVAWPQSTQGTRLFKDAPAHWPKLAAYHQRIERILSVPAPIDEDGALVPSLIPLSAEAKTIWVGYHDEVEARLAVGGDYADVRDVASKSADNAARLAALFHIFEHGGGGAIGLSSMESGCMVAAWHLQESRRFLGEIAVSPDMANAMRVIRWLLEFGSAKAEGMVTTRDLQRLGPVRNKDCLDAALRELQDHHQVRLRADGRRKLVEVNPALWGVSPK
jgi:putative DNA primase/helicase